MDLRDFFPSITAARVVAVFMTAGYPENVARLMAGLCTSRVPSDVWKLPGAAGQGAEAWRSALLYRHPHLPQGAPTSPALANLCAFRLDARLDGLAGVAGARYTRYADDLVFSGEREFERSLPRFLIHVGATAIEEGFNVQPRKTRVMRCGTRQQVAGVVVNERPNLARERYDRLKAILHNCLKSGPEAQNRSGHSDFRAHLTGCVAHASMLDPARGAKLQAMLDGVAWGSGT
jgi:RNA-directed DNA polymerase